MILKCIAVDDEPLALDIIEDYISKVPFLELVKRTENAIEALQLVQAGGIDLVFFRYTDARINRHTVFKNCQW